MTAFNPWAYADLFICNRGGHNNILRYDEKTGDFLGEFIPPGSGGLSRPQGLIFGPDGNLYVSDDVTSSILRYDGVTGAPLPSPGNTGATFVRAGSGGLTFEFTGWLIFGPDGNLYIRSTPNFGDLGAVLRYDRTTGAFIDEFIPYGSGGLKDNDGFVFRNTDPTTLTYVAVSRFHITVAPIVVSGAPFDVTVTALDPYGKIDSNYQGTVTFTTMDPDSGVVLPADYTFTTGDGGDNGVHTFTAGVTLITVGDQTLTVTDTVSGVTGTVIIAVGSGP